MKPLSLVIDTSTARACGQNSESARRSRESLETIRQREFRVAMTEKLLDEWRRHRSSYARSWLNYLYGSKRIDSIEEVLETTRLSTAIASLPNKKEEVAQKDRFLVDMAVQTDKRIISNDNEAGSVFCFLAKSVKAIQLVHWVNPLFEGSNNWLINDAPEHLPWTLATHEVFADT